MKKIVFYIFSLFEGIMTIAIVSWAIAMPISATAQGADLARLTATGLQVVVVETVGGEEPSCEFLRVDSGYPGNTIRNATKVPGRIVVIEGGDTLYDSRAFDGIGHGMTIKMRGNNSAFRSKHPFKVKLQCEGDMLCRGDDATYADRDWLLLDGSTLNMMMGMTVSRLVGVQWTPAYRYVNLLFNGEYRGIYILAEAVKRNPRCRLDVDADEGCIIERDAYWWNSQLYFEGLTPGHEYTFKWPDPDKIDNAQVECARLRVIQWEQAVKDGTYDRHIDVGSFAAWLLAHDILGTSDYAGSNIFLTWHDAEAKICMGNIWDMDTNYGSEGRWAPIHQWWGFPIAEMLRSNNPSLALALLARWDEAEPKLFEELDRALTTFTGSEEYEALEQSRRIENDSLGYRFTLISSEIEKARQWFTCRRAWLQQAMELLRAELFHSNCSQQFVDSKAEISRRYDLQGRHLSGKPIHGVYISGGKKFVSHGDGSTNHFSSE